MPRIATRPHCLLVLTLALAACGGGDGPAGNGDPVADLQVQLAGALQGASGSTVTATVSVTNAGPAGAEGVVVELAVPAHVAVTAISPATGVREADRVRWALDAVADGASQALSVELTMPMLSATPLTATVSGATPDGVSGNNTATRTLRALPVARYTVSGEGAGDTFGWIAQNIGDVDGDGRDDALITAPFNDAGGNDAGRAYVHSGATGARLQTITGDVAASQLGYGAAALGDVNGDNVPDFAVGAPGINNPALPGYALVVSGADGSTLFRFTGPVPGEATGYSVGRAGDLTGDGVPDVLVSAPLHDGAAGRAVGAIYIVSGANGTLAATLEGPVPGAAFGVGVGNVGDLDRDGTPDFVVGSSNESGGRIRAYSGATRALLLPAMAGPTGASLGQFWLLSPGDLDGDAVPDIYGADINVNDNRGQAYVFSGATGAILRTFAGEAAGDQFGMGRPIADVTGDGRADFVLAAWRSAEGAAAAGKGYVVDGATGSVLRSFASVTAGETLGFDILSLGDVTGDGEQDFLVTAGQETGTGRAYLVAGVPLP